MTEERRSGSSDPDNIAMTGHSPAPEPPDRPDRFGPDALHDMRDLSEDTARKLLKAFEGSHPVQRLRGNQVATAVVGTVGFALFLVGIENAVHDIPIIDNGWSQMALGLLLLAAAGVLLRRFME